MGRLFKLLPLILAGVRWYRARKTNRPGTTYR